MEFNEKLQELRRQKGLTQEKLAEKLYVSRTAVSKWESDRGYPNIESLKAIAKFFSVTVDELLSSDEVLTIAEENQKQTEKRFRDLWFGLVDICMSMLLFLPLFAVKADGFVSGASLLTLGEAEPYLKITYLFAVLGTVATGVATLALQNCTAKVWLKCKTKISLAFGVIAVLLFMISRQAYASVFAFCLLAVKTVMLVKRV